MADSKREIIVQDVETTLGTITKANGYNNDVVKVSRNLKNYQREQNVPAWFIVVGVERSEPGTNEEYDRILPVRAIAVVKAKEDVSEEGLLSKEMEKILMDVFKAMHVDIRRGNPSFVDYTYYRGATPIYDWGKQRGYLGIDFEVRFHHPFDSP